ncbi:hypothetical protein EV666_13113 [Camelimonas lactis]|uniref:Uncharacterized protein n=1 Tax=Camelimonas lactis TaxID=659006 RepID=A0A4R2GGU2_9HYPH|nr:hypothetical protein EV666_13113 [Camelimonas lactis]
MTNTTGPATAAFLEQQADLRRRAATQLKAPHIAPTDEDRHDVEQERAREAHDDRENHSR